MFMLLYDLWSVADGSLNCWICVSCEHLSAAECLIEDIRNYRYLTHGNVPVAGQDDEELYRQLLEAMDIMGFSKEEQIGKSVTLSRHNILESLWMLVLIVTDGF